MNRVIVIAGTAALALAAAKAVSAADVYVEGDYRAIWDNLDQDTTSIGTGIAFHPAKNLMIDVGADYIANNDLSHSGYTGTYSRKERSQRINHRQYEDDMMLGIKIRYNIWSF